ncbi:MAG: hypothetical protein AAGI92_12730, partial [Pseudomonadota bacterium]
RRIITRVFGRIGVSIVKLLSVSTTLLCVFSLAGCNAFQRDTRELPPPPQGNIIATSTSTPQERRGEFNPPPRDPSLETGPTVTGQAGSTVEECRDINNTPGQPNSSLGNGQDADQCVQGSVSLGN